MIYFSASLPKSLTASCGSTVISIGVDTVDTVVSMFDVSVEDNEGSELYKREETHGLEE